MQNEKTPPVIDYEGSDYQTRFWDSGGRDYEDLCEAYALKRLLPKSGKLLLELGAGAGRNTSRYQGFKRIVLLDYSRTQLKRAQERLGKSGDFIYVAGDIYRLPLIENLFDAATMIRTLHHMADAPRALREIKRVLQKDATFILEYANKQNLKAILRYLLRKQSWNPFSLDPIEFAPLNFNFHPQAVRKWLNESGFQVEKTLAVSHFRMNFLKRTISAGILAGMDSLLQWTGALWQGTPSIFIKLKSKDGLSISIPEDPILFFKCPECGRDSLVMKKGFLKCSTCQHEWIVENGIFDFRGN